MVRGARPTWLRMLRCKTPEMVQKEIAVHLLAYNIIRGNLAQATIMHNKIPRQLSFRSTVQLVCQATKQMVVLTGKRLTYALLPLIQGNGIDLNRFAKTKEPTACH